MPLHPVPIYDTYSFRIYEKVSMSLKVSIFGLERLEFRMSVCAGDRIENEMEMVRNIVTLRAGWYS